MLPDFLKSFQDQAEEYLNQNLVGEIEFAGSTYQVQVFDLGTRQENWAFLQLDKRGQIRDCFCSCESPEAKSSCIHLASAYLRVYSGHREPLHVRFQGSLWNTLLRLYSDRIGVHPDSLAASGSGKYTYYSDQGALICSIKGKTAGAKQRLKEMIDFRRRETEETSLKFSNLSQEEIASWREGRPGSRLNYELSYWNDLAKWLMLLQDEKKKYTIRFKYEELPTWITISFDEIELEFTLFPEELPKIIPSLATVNSPLVVHQVEEEMIEAITYDKVSGCMSVIPAKGTTIPKKEGLQVEEWLYVPREGFYLIHQHAIVEQKKWCGKQVGELLDKHQDLLKKTEVGPLIHSSTPVRFFYEISYDPNWNLHIVSYLRQPGDLTRDFGNWIYLDEEGFFPVEERRFDQIDFVVPREEVADFVRLQRGFLNHCEGFHIHLTSIESHYTYRLTPEKTLTFQKQLLVQDSDEKLELCDFGTFIYIKGRGFYPKSTAQMISPIKEDLVLKADQISSFIRQNREELQTIPHFFSERCPVGHVSLRVELTPQETILIKPIYGFYPEYRDCSVAFIDDFTFVEGEGFHELPPDMRLPDRFRQPLELEPENLEVFLTQELEGLSRWASYIDHRLLKPATLIPVADEIEKKGKGWFSVVMRYQSDWGSISLLDLLLARKREGRFVFSPAGLIDLEEAKFEWLKGLNEERFAPQENRVDLKAIELIKLNIFDEIQVLQPVNLMKELTEFTTPEEPDLKGLKSTLRPYQMLGVKWLWFLYQNNLSGLLCDDMGLGKTHQSMALIAAIKNELPDRPLHFLIVCPTSVLYHWEEKLAAFLPHLKVCTFYGTQRSLKQFSKKYDILLTSYGVWRIEKELLQEIPFELAIFDEAQIAKNQSSRIHHALAAVKANMRLGLTGTPIENYLRELKALFDLVLPAYMPNHAEFRRMFVKPIEREEDPQKRTLLKRFINPFILRRRKEEVLVDLPAKTEEASYCDLSIDQKMLYFDVLEKSHKNLFDQLQDKQTPIPYIHIFALLSHLKQICDHPAVYLKEGEHYTQYQSGKWELFLELLHEALDSEQKVVVYSQYLVMLDIMENYLAEQGISYATIRGATRKRGEEIERFNSDPKCRVFVGSLQAAGLGIDLTAASVVIHYDRWWNAARENQATDRIHRIGQTRGVQVFKLITKGTFEERIDAMIKRKGKMMEEIVGLDDHQILKQFTRDELLDLLQYIEEEK